MTERLQHILIAIARPRCLTWACVVVALLLVTTIAVPSLGGEVDKEAFAVAAGLEDTMNRLGQDYVAHYAVEHYFPANSIEPSLVRNGIIARKGNNIRYSIQCPNDTPPEPQDRDGLQSVPCLQEDILIADDILLTYGAYLKTVNICTTPETNQANFLTPLTMGFTGRGDERSFLSLVDRGETGGTSDLTIKFLGRSGSKWSFHCESTETGRSGYRWTSIVEWSFDESKSFLPVGAIAYDSPDVWSSRFDVKEFRELKPAVFWPWISEITENTEVHGTPTRFVVRTMSVSFAPEAILDSMALEIPAGVRAVELSDAGSWFLLPEGSIRPSDAQALVDRSVEAFNERRARRLSRGQRVPIETGWSFLQVAGILSIAAVVVAIAVASVLILRR